MGVPEHPGIPVWLPGAQRDPRSNTGFHVTATVHSPACSDGELGAAQAPSPSREG